MQKMRGKGLGLAVKQIVSILLVACLVFLPVVMLLTSSADRMVTENVLEKAEEMAVGYGRYTENTMNNMAVLVRTLARDFMALRTEGVTERMVFNRMLMTQMESSDNLSAVWTLWEPDALDGRDAEYANTDGYDGTGRYQNWLVRDGASIERFLIEDYIDPEVNDYYYLAMESKRETILEPYVDTELGEHALVTSVVAPLVADGQAMGVVGVDVRLGELQETFSGIAPYDTGYVSLISDTGLYITNPDAEKVLTTIDYGDPEILVQLNSGTLYKAQYGDDYKVFVPVRIGETGKYWGLEVSIPMSVALSDVSDMKNLNTILIFAGLLILAVCVILLVRNITAPIRRISQAAQSLSEGQTDVVVHLKRRDEIGVLADSFGQMCQRIQSLTGEMGKLSRAILDGRLDYRVSLESYSGEYRMLVGHMNEVADSVNTLMTTLRDTSTDVARSSQQISSASQQMAQGATEQAASLEQLTNTVSGIADKTRQNAEGAKTCQSVTSDVIQSAHEGSGKMRDLRVSVDDTSKATQSISVILKSIDDIAFQTNILALNAAVEAARAGQHGKGFAVVAGEVRTLATKSSQAAQQTGQLIEEILTRTSEGVELAAATDESLRKIVAGIDQANRYIVDMANSSSEQAVAVGEVNSVLQQVSNVVQANAATAEQSASAAQIMSEQAGVLNGMVGRYQLLDVSRPEGLPQRRAQ